MEHADPIDLMRRPINIPENKPTNNKLKENLSVNSLLYIIEFSTYSETDTQC